MASAGGRPHRAQEPPTQQSKLYPMHPDLKTCRGGHCQGYIRTDTPAKFTATPIAARPATIALRQLAPRAHTSMVLLVNIPCNIFTISPYNTRIKLLRSPPPAAHPSSRPPRVPPRANRTTPTHAASTGVTQLVSLTCANSGFRRYNFYPRSSHTNTQEYFFNRLL